MSERLYSTGRAAELLSLCKEDVLRLGRLGKLKLVPQIVRGTGAKPRLYVLASELDRYIKELGARPEPVVEPVKRRRPRPKTGLAAELAAATRYV